jgi:hypothetical protein
MQAATEVPQVPEPADLPVTIIGPQTSVVLGELYFAQVEIIRRLHREITLAEQEEHELLAQELLAAWTASREAAERLARLIGIAWH